MDKHDNTSYVYIWIHWEPRPRPSLCSDDLRKVNCHMSAIFILSIGLSKSNRSCHSLSTLRRRYRDSKETNRHSWSVITRHLTFDKANFDYGKSVKGHLQVQFHSHTHSGPDHVTWSGTNCKWASDQLEMSEWCTLTLLTPLLCPYKFINIKTLCKNFVQKVVTQIFDDVSANQG